MRLTSLLEGMNEWRGGMGTCGRVGGDWRDMNRCTTRWEDESVPLFVTGRWSSRGGMAHGVGYE